VLTVPPSVKIYLAAGATDMRRSMDGLAALVRDCRDSCPAVAAPFV
jgi:hypothetical protein